MALKAMVVKTGLPNAGALLGVHDAAALPPLPTDNTGAVVAEWVDTASQAADQVWDRATKTFVSPAVVAKTKSQLENETLGPSWSAWWRWKTTLDEITARNVAVPGTYSPAVVTAVTNKVNAAFAQYGGEINTWRLAT